MNKILELEALRGIASLYVFFHHTLFSFGIIHKNSLIGKFFSFGQEAVMVFFLLSGYVIALSLNKRQYSFKTYFKHRFFRIYTVVIMGWMISFISIYFSDTTLIISISEFAKQFLVNIFMLQDISALKPGTFADPLFGDSPLWSLSYEWWFYMIFFVHYTLIQKYFRGNLSLFNISALLLSIIGILSFKVNYNQVSLIIMYYYVWFSGAITLLYITKNQFQFYSTLMTFISYIIIILLYSSLFVFHQNIISIGVHPLLELRHYSATLLLFLFSILFYKIIYTHIKNNKFYKKIIYFFSLIAPLSFSLYVFHYPIKNYMERFNEVNGIVLLIITLLISLVLSYLVEIKLYNLIRKKI